MENLPVDRLYYYGADRPVHVSYGPERRGDFLRWWRGEKGAEESQ